MALMPVYRGAIDASVTGEVQYIIGRSLDIFRTDDPEHAIKYLASGWDLKGVCNNGTLYENWRIDADQIKDDPSLHAIYKRICSIIGCSEEVEDLQVVRIYTQEFYGLYDAVTVYMTIEIWRKSDKKPWDILITPKSSVVSTKDGTVANPRFHEGQEKAQKILELLALNSVKQDKDSLIHQLRIRNA